MSFSDACWKAVTKEFAARRDEIVARVTESVAQAEPAVKGDQQWKALLEQVLAPVPGWCLGRGLLFTVKIDAPLDCEALPWGQDRSPVFEKLVEKDLKGISHDVLLGVVAVGDSVMTPLEYSDVVCSIVGNVERMRLYEQLPPEGQARLVAAVTRLMTYVADAASA